MLNCKNKQETLRTVNNRHDLLHPQNFNIFGDLYITQSNIYDGAFNAKIVTR